MEKPKPKRPSRSAKSEAQEEFVAMLPALAAASPIEKDKPTEMKKAGEKAVVEKASAYTVDNIIKGIADLNINLGKALSDLSGKLATEANKLAELQKATRVRTTD